LDELAQLYELKYLPNEFGTVERTGFNESAVNSGFTQLLQVIA